MTDITVTCPNCAQASTLDAFTTRHITGQLPPGQYQCPLCNYAFQRREVTKGEVWTARNGERLYIPGKLALVPCAARL